MSHIEELHEQAMDLAEEAFDSRRKGRDDEARLLFQQALELERQAALGLSLSTESEPTRSILFRSASSLAFHAGDYVQAEKLAANGIAGFPPPEIEAELRSLQDDVNFHRHMSLHGLELTDYQSPLVSIHTAVVLPKVRCELASYNCLDNLADLSRNRLSD